MSAESDHYHQFMEACCTPNNQTEILELIETLRSEATELRIFKIQMHEGAQRAANYERIENLALFLTHPHFSIPQSELSWIMNNACYHKHFQVIDFLLPHIQNETFDNIMSPVKHLQPAQYPEGFLYVHNILTARLSKQMLEHSVEKHIGKADHLSTHARKL